MQVYTMQVFLALESHSTHLLLLGPDNPLLLPMQTRQLERWPHSPLDDETAAAATLGQALHFDLQGLRCERVAWDRGGRVTHTTGGMELLAASKRSKPLEFCWTESLQRAIGQQATKPRL
jgi:hypothetical protein